MKRLLILELLAVCSIISGYAYDFQSNGIYYNINIGDNNTVSVTNGTKYEGDIIIPSEVVHYGVSYSVTSIGSLAFSGCSKLTSITIPNSVTSIGSSAFSGCSKLTSITIPNSVTSIGNGAFGYCSALTSITIPNSVTTIGKSAFDSCSGLTSITIGNSVTSIGNYAFYGCSGLTSITIPNSVTSIGKSAFHSCSGLASITVSSRNTIYDSRVNCNAIIETSSNTIISGCKNTIIPNSVTSIGDYAFIGCTCLTSITIPNSVTSIGDDAFSYCDGLTSITIPNSVTSIGERAFSNCSGLTSITIPNSVTSIGDLAFNECSGLTSVVSEIQNPFETKEYVFSSSTYTKATLTVPVGTKSKYQLTNYWNKFTNIVESTNAVKPWAVIKNPMLTSYTQVMTLEIKGKDNDDDVTKVALKSLAGVKFTYQDGDDTKDATTTADPILKAIEGTDNQFEVHVDGLADNTYTLVMPAGTFDFSQNPNPVEDTELRVPFKIETPSTTYYSLNISSSGYGYASYNNTTIRNRTQSFTLDEGTSATIIFTPDNGNSIASVKLNNSDITSQISGNSYTINNITANTTLTVTFLEDVNALTVDGLNYTVTSQSNRTVTLTSGGSGQVLTVPATITQNGTTWKVTGIDKDALKGNAELAAIIWNPEAAFAATVSNPNLLLYVKSSDYAPATIQNVVVNVTASNIVLTEAKSGNNFYCPQSFVAQKISYTHNYKMQTGIGEARGWETIALPFDVQTITHATKGTIKPFANWKSGDTAKPFWLMELTGTGFVETGSIKAYTPYIISMPNNSQYDNQWLLNGKVTFAANSVTVGKTENLSQPTFNGRTFIPNFSDMDSETAVYSLNVNNDYETNNSGMAEGSMFVWKSRHIHPFEAFMTSSSSSPQYAIGVFEGMTTGIQMMVDGNWTKKEVVYDLQGRKVNAPSKKGVYIVNGKKKIIK